MAPEIADSDDEGDHQIQALNNHIIPERYDTDRVAAEFTEMAEPDPVLNFDFETYCSPTQHLSDFDVDQYNTTQQDSGLASSHQLDSSTDRFLNEVAPIDSSYVAEAHRKPIDSDQVMGGKGSATKAGHKRTRSEFSGGALEVQNGSANKKTRTHEFPDTSSGRSNATQEFSVLNHGVGMNSSGMISVEPRTQYTPDTVSLLSPFDGSNGKSRGVSNQMYSGPQEYTRSGSFQNMQGGMANRSSMGNYQSYNLDRSALDGNFSEINPFGQPSQVDDNDALAKIFKPKSVSRQSTSQDSVDGFMLQMQTSPIKSNPTVAPQQLVTRPDLPSASPPFSPITNPDENPGLEGVIHAEDLDDMIEIRPVERISLPEAQGAPKKRGRKPKQKIDENTKVIEHEEADLLHLVEQNVKRSDRAGTVDSVSNVSEISQATSSSKPGRKKKSKKQIDPMPEELSKKLPSSDLGLDNKAVIGLSPERYVPRPSRRRGRAEPEPLPEVDIVESMVVELDNAPQEVPSKGKKGRKGKGKQKAPIVEEIHTAEDDHLEDGENMIDEAVDNAPKKASEDASVRTEEDDVDDEMPKGAGRRAKITVDVPVLSRPAEEETLHPVAPEPKKRGRKKKKQIEIPMDEPITHDDYEEDRPALAERDGNIQSKRTNPSKISPEAEIEPKVEEEESEDSKPALPATPSNTLSSTTPSSKTVVHSDFKPLSATPFFNTKGRVGLSKRFSIPSLLRKVDRNKEAPKAIERKEKLNKRQLEEREAERIAKEEAEAEGREYVPLHQLRGKDGRLIEWDF